MTSAGLFLPSRTTMAAADLSTTETTQVWTNITLVNGWTQYGDTTYNTAQYCKDAHGNVHLRGLITQAATVAFGLAFTLPAGFNPVLGSDFLSFAIMTDTGMDIARLTTSGFALNGPHAWASLDGITFPSNNFSGAVLGQSPANNGLVTRYEGPTGFGFADWVPTGVSATGWAYRVDRHGKAFSDASHDDNSGATASNAGTFTNFFGTGVVAVSAAHRPTRRELFIGYTTGFTAATCHRLDVLADGTIIAADPWSVSGGGVGMLGNMKWWTPPTANVIAAWGTQPANLAPIPQEWTARTGTWTAVTFLNSWVNFDPTGASFNFCEYFKDSYGWVHLRGLVDGGANLAAIFNFPVGFRPVKNTLFCMPWSGAFSGAGARVDVHSVTDANPGSVVPIGITGGAAGQYLCLDGISFSTT